MSSFRRNASVRAVIRAQQEGDRRYQSRDVAGAIAQYGLGCRLVREMLAAHPPDAKSVQQLAAMLYTLGQWQRDVGLRAEAVSSLDEAEELYRRLGGEATQFVADVVIRRANVRAELGAPLSAIEDVQQAVVASMKWGRQDPSRELDVARVIGIAASVHLSIGADPDLACAAADWEDTACRPSPGRTTCSWQARGSSRYARPSGSRSRCSATRRSSSTHRARMRGRLH